MNYPPRIPRKDVPAYLRDKHGIIIGASKLDKMAMRDVGPKFRIVAGRATYEILDLDAYAAELLGEPAAA